MAAKATHDLATKTGEYQQDGQTKGRWLNIGRVFKHDDGGTSIKIDCIPIGLKDWEGWVSVFPRKDDSGQQPQQPQQQRQAPSKTAQQNRPVQQSFDDDVPF